MNYHKQLGMSMMNTLSVLILAGFILMTGFKLVPMYLEFQTISKIIDEVATNANPKTDNHNEIRATLARHLQVNGINNPLIKKDTFMIEKPGKDSNTKHLSISYENRKPWVGNIDLVASFSHKRELGK